MSSGEIDSSPEAKRYGAGGGAFSLASMERRSVALPEGRDALAAVEVVERLREAGHQAFLVGGCVRDLLLGIVPKDWDVATAAIPTQTAGIFSRVISVGIDFGVLRVLVGRGAARREVEVATFRADGAYGDGRRPDEVRFTDAREDVLRRDFTMNGLLGSPQDGRVEIVDMVGGHRDLQRGLLRAIGDPVERLREDGLRILRAVRFAARFGLRLETRTRAALRSEAAMLERVSAERILQELRGSLCSPHAARTASLLGVLDLPERLWPSLRWNDPGLERATHRIAVIQAVLDATTAPFTGTLEVERSIDLPLALVALFDDLLPKNRKAQQVFARDLRLSLAEAHRLWAIAAAAEGLEALSSTASLRDPSVIRILREPHADGGLLIVMGRARISGRSTKKWSRWRVARGQIVRAQWWPHLWVDGAALKALGYRPGPAFKRAIEAAQELQLVGKDRQAVFAAAEAELKEG